MWKHQTSFSNLYFEVNSCSARWRSNYTEPDYLRNELFIKAIIYSMIFSASSRLTLPSVKPNLLKDRNVTRTAVRVKILNLARANFSSKPFLFLSVIHEKIYGGHESVPLFFSEITRKCLKDVNTVTVFEKLLTLEWGCMFISCHVFLRVNLHSIVVWMSRKPLLETGAISEV